MALRLPGSAIAHLVFSRQTTGYAICMSESSTIDKITGRVKKAVGDLADDAGLRHEGRKEERKGEAKDQLDSAVERVGEKAREVEDLERRT